MGVVHMFFALPIEHFNLGYIWYFGSGLAILFNGALNLIGIENKRTPIGTGLILLANVLMCFAYIGVLFALPEPQVYIGIALFAALAILTVVDYRKRT